MVGEEMWRYQGGTGDQDYIYGAAALSYGSFILAGVTYGSWVGSNAGNKDLVAVKIASNGTFLWTWQGGSSGSDKFRAVVALDDDSIVAAGYVDGTWNGDASLGGQDFAAVKLLSNGTTVWSWREGTDKDDRIYSAAVTTDGSIVLAGYTGGNWTETNNAGYADAAAVKLDANGTVIWRWQGGSKGTGHVYIDASTARPDGSVVLAGHTYGRWIGSSWPEATTDFVAVALDEYGVELWRWQDGANDGGNRLYAATALADGSVVLAGYTDGNWSGSNEGGGDFAAVKLGVDGVEEWRWQDGSIEDDLWSTAASGTDGAIILAGGTYGSWQKINEGAHDFAAISLDADGEALWTYQEGTVEADEFNAAAVRAGGAVLLAGSTTGSWDVSDSDSDNDFAAVLLDTGVAATTPPPTVLEPATTSPPTSSELATTSPSPIPSLAASSVPIASSTSSSGSDTGRNIIMAGAVVGVGLSLAVLGVCSFRCRRPTRTVGSSAPA